MAAGRIKGITIEIGGDTTKLVSALKNVDKEIKGTQTALKDINSLLKVDPSNVELLRQKQSQLTEAVSATRDRLKTLQEAQSQVTKGSSEWDALQREIIATKQDLDGLEGDLKEFGSVGKQQLKALTQKVGEFGSKLQEAGDKISKVGSTLTQKVTTPIVAGMGAAIKVTADFDAQMSKVQAISGATATDMERLSEKARKMGETTKFSATESGEAMEYMAMAGWKTEQMVDGLDGIMYLAAAANEELGTTSDIVTDGLTAFHMEAEESSHFANVLAAASANANTNVSLMGETFKYVAPVAGAVGYTIEDMALATGLMANAGIKGSMAGTSLRNVIQRMAKPTKESAAAMDRLGLSMSDETTGRMYTFREIMDQIRVSFKEINMSTEDYDQQLTVLQNALDAGTITQKQYNTELEELNKQAFGAEGAEKARAAAMLGGARAMSGLMAIAEASEEDYEKLAAAIDGSSESMAMLADGSIVPLNEALASGQEIIGEYGGAAEAMAMQMQNNLTGDVTILKSALQELAISLGELLMPLLRDLVAQIQEVVNYLNSLDDETKKQIIQAALIVAAIGPVLMILGKLVSVIGFVMSHLSAIQAVIAAITGPIGIAIAAIAAFIAIFVYLYNTNEEFRDKCLEVWAKVQEGISSFVEIAKAFLTEFIEWVQPIFMVLVEAASEAMDIIGEIFTEVGAWIEENRAEIEAAVAVIRTIVMFLVNVIKAYVITNIGIIKEQITAFLNIISSLFKAFVALLKGDWRGAWNYLVQAVSSYGNMLKNIFLRIVDGIKMIFGGLIEKMKNWGKEMIESLIAGIKEKIGGVAEAITGGLGKFASFFTDAGSAAGDILGNLQESALGAIGDLVPVQASMARTASTMTANRSTAAPALALQSAPVVVNVALEGDATRLFRVVKAEAVRTQQITGMAFV